MTVRILWVLLAAALTACGQSDESDRDGDPAAGRASTAFEEDADDVLAQGLALLERGEVEAGMDRITEAFARGGSGAGAPDDPGTLARLQLVLLPLPPEVADPRLLINATLGLAVVTDLGTARQAVFDWTRRDANAYSPLLTLGHLANVFGHAEPARMWFERAHLAAPHRTEAALGLGTVHAAAGRLEAARHAFDALLERHPDLAVAHLRRGNVFGEQGKEEPALADWRRAMELDEGDTGAQAANLVGAVLVKRGDTEGALEAFQRARVRDPSSPVYAFNAGQLLHQMHRPEPARSALTEAAELRPDDQRPHYLLGRIAEDESEDGEAERHYRRALELEPADERTRYALTRLLERTGRADEAARLASTEGS